MEARICIDRLNQSVVRGWRIIVDWARGSSSGKQKVGMKKSKQTWIPRASSNFSMDETSFRVKGDVNEEFLEWLQRSLICTANAPRDLDALAYLIKDNFGPISRISAFSGVKYLLTFPTVQDMNEALANPMELTDWFKDIRPWSKYDSADSRRVWIDIVGVPPHGWSWDNFQKCAQPWGKLLSLARCISSSNQFEVMRALIQTDVFKRIDGELLMDIQSCSYRIFIREVSTHLIPPSMSHIQESSKSSGYSSEDEESSQHIEDEFQNNIEMVQDSSILRVSLSNGVIQETPDGQGCDDQIQPVGNANLHQLSNGEPQQNNSMLPNWPTKEGNRQSEGSNYNSNGKVDELCINEHERLDFEKVVESGNESTLAMVPVINDDQLIMATTTLGDKATFGLEKSVEVVSDINSQINVHDSLKIRAQKSSPIPINPNNDESVNELELNSIASDNDSVIKAREYITEKAIKFGEKSGFMRAKRNINAKKYFVDKLSVKKKKKSKESERRKRILAYSRAYSTEIESF